MSHSQPASAQAESSKYIMYVGTYGKGIYAFRFDAVSGAFQPLGIAGQLINPSFVITERRFHHLYAVSELEGNENGAVAAFSINAKSGMLQFLNSRSSAGIAPCHLAVDNTSKMLLVANYGTGGVSAFPLEKDGSIGQMSALMVAHGSSANPERQTGPHAHEVVISSDNRRAYVPDLGLDQIRIYNIDPAVAGIAPGTPPYLKEAPGLGPRHMVFSPNGRFAYVVNELKPEITVFSHDSASGQLTQIQMISMVPRDFTGESGPAEILIDHAGRFVYASNRGPGTIGVFAVDPPSGTLRQIQLAETGGTWPRGVELDPTGHWLIVGDQKANELTVLRVDPHTGQLGPTGIKEPVTSPVSFAFVPAH